MPARRPIGPHIFPLAFALTCKARHCSLLLAQALTYFPPEDKPLLDLLCRWTVAFRWVAAALITVSFRRVAAAPVQSSLVAVSRPLGQPLLCIDCWVCWAC